MRKATLEFLDISEHPLTYLKTQRMIDWSEEGDNIMRKFEKHQEQYRENICKKCSTVQQKKRQCQKIPEIDSNGNPLTFCEHMNKATHSKYRKEISKYINSNPVIDSWV